MQGGYHIRMGGFGPLPKYTRQLIFLNVAIWIGAIWIIQDIIFRSPVVFHYFGLVPEGLFSHFRIWQPLTYMFIHAGGFFHIFFNMFVLWWLGAELERFWGGKKFITYYLVGGIGSALIYTLVLATLEFFQFSSPSLDLAFKTPVVGASGAIFALILAYGYHFSERTIYFMLFFPMKSSHFTILLAFIELLSLLRSGLNGSVSHLSHLGGFVAGGLYIFITHFGGNFGGGSSSQKDGNYINLKKRRKRKLRLIVNNEDGDSGDTDVWH